MNKISLSGVDSIDMAMSKLRICKPTDRPFILNKLATLYQESNLDDAISYSEQAIQSAEKLNDSINLANGLLNLGYIQMLKGNNSDAIVNITKSYQLFYKLNIRLGIAEAGDNLGSLYRYMGSNEKSLDYHLKSLTIFKDYSDTAGIICSLNNLGILYRGLENYSNAFSYYSQALSLAKKSKSIFLTTIYNSIGSYYWYLESNDSALVYYNRVLKIDPKTPLLKERYCAALNNLGNVYRSMEKLDSALYYYNLSLEKSTQYDFVNLKSITLKNFGILYSMQGNCPQALENIKKSIEIANRINLKRIVRDDYYLLSDIYAKQNDYKNAFQYHKLYSAYQESVYSDEQANKITQIEIDNIIRQKEMDKALLSKNIAEQNLKIQRNRSILIILSLVVAFFALLSYSILRLLKLSKNSAKMLEEMNEELESKVRNRTKNLQSEIVQHKITAAALIKAKEKAEESDRLKSSFLANLSHEIRTPMNAINGFTELLRDYALEPEKKNEYISIIRKSGHKLLLIINDIIEISKIETGQIVPHMKPVDVNDFIDDLYKTMIVTIPKEKDIKLEIALKRPIPDLTILTDEVKLLQIMSNLLNNAIKYTEKGSIEFGYDVIDEDSIHFFVKDTGVGIDEKNKDIIFERFRRIEGDLAIKKGGSGLGLAISKAYIEMLGGSIKVESKLGEGSTFSFTIPLKKTKKIEPIRDIEVQEIISSGNPSNIILVAEDDDINYLYFKEILSGLDFTIIRAKNGQEAIDMCSKSSDIKLVLMDIKMPQVDGYDALKAIRKINPKLPVIAQTSYALPEDKLLINNAGFDDYLTKPIDKDKLLRLVKDGIKSV